MKRIFSFMLVVCLIFTGAGSSFAKKAALRVVKTTPKASKKNVKVKPTIKVNFNKKISKGKKFSKIVLKGKKKAAIKVTIKGKQLVIKPKKKLQEGTKYTLRVPKKAVKNKKANNKVFKLVFTTKKKAKKVDPTDSPAPTAEATVGPGATPTPAAEATPTPAVTPTIAPTPTPVITPTPTPSGPRIQVPTIDGNWWMIADDEPDLSPWEIEHFQGGNVCDFTIYQSEDGKWHLVACVRGTTNPYGTRLLAHWESDDIESSNWKSTGVFATADEIGTPADEPGEMRGLQAPHCIKKDGKYYMFFNSKGAYCITSDDGTNWKTDGEWNRMKNTSASHRIFDMGRDVNVFDNTERDGTFYAYYTGKATGASVDTFVYRTASDLQGPWSSTVKSAKDEGNPESPFMLYKNGYYYLWQQHTVYVSDTPTDFNKKPLTNMWEWKYAPEIIEYNGQYYAAAYAEGIHLAKVKWVEVGDVKPNIYNHWTPAGVVGTEYKATLRANKGDGELTWSITGNLPDGLEINRTTGYDITLSGTPTKAGNYSFTIIVTDEDGDTAMVNKIIEITAS